MSEQRPDSTLVAALSRGVDCLKGQGYSRDDYRQELHGPFVGRCLYDAANLIPNDMEFEAYLALGLKVWDEFDALAETKRGGL